jgi:hypothetical protein
MLRDSMATSPGDSAGPLSLIFLVTGAGLIAFGLLALVGHPILRVPTTRLIDFWGIGAGTIFVSGGVLARLALRGLRGPVASAPEEGSAAGSPRIPEVASLAALPRLVTGATGPSDGNAPSVGWAAASPTPSLASIEPAGPGGDRPSPWALTWGDTVPSRGESPPSPDIVAASLPGAGAPGPLGLEERSRRTEAEVERLRSRLEEIERLQKSLASTPGLSAAHAAGGRADPARPGSLASRLTRVPAPPALVQTSLEVGRYCSGCGQSLGEPPHFEPCVGCGLPLCETCFWGLGPGPEEHRCPACRRHLGGAPGIPTPLSIAPVAGTSSPTRPGGLPGGGRRDRPAEH